jgi:hypothetical protein
MAYRKPPLFTRRVFAALPDPADHPVFRLNRP